MSAPTPGEFPPATGTAVRTSVGNAASGGDQPLISQDGHWQVFRSSADLDPTAPVNSTSQVFVRDLRTGAVTQLSVGSGATAPDGVSGQPSISANGRYVSFITHATNIATTPPGRSNPLVVCDRDPTGATDPNTHEPIFDQRDPVTGVLTNVCQTEYAGSTPGNSLVESERPRLSGDGSRIVWVRNAGQGGLTEIRYVDVTDFQGSLVAPSSIDGNPVPVNLAGPSFTIFNESAPVLDHYGFNVAFVANTTAGNAMVLNVRLGSLPVTTRLDADPQASGTYLGDEGDANNYISFDSVSITSYDDTVVFHESVNPIVLKFGARPAALAAPPALPTQRVYLYNGTTTLVSRDDSTSPSAIDGELGEPVDATAPALSADGRYLAFVTSAANTHDGVPVSNAVEIVARDLTLDAARKQQNLPRLKGALVTAQVPAACTLVAPAVNCASAGGLTADLSLDGSGARISFSSTATDLVTGDGNAAVDAFVHTWQPQLLTAPFDFGTVQTGANKTQDVPVQVQGFGPLEVDSATIAGIDATDFTTTGNTCVGGTVHVDAPCTVAVKFAPTVDGAKSADLRITSPQLDGPATADTLAGTASPFGPKNAPATTVRTSLTPAGAEAPFGGSQSMISGNGRWDVFVSYSDLAGRKPSPTASDQENVYVRDLADPQRTIQISLHSTLGSTPAAASRPVATANHPAGVNPDGGSYAPSISSDGRFVSFLTAATDVVPPRLGGNNDPYVQYLVTAVVCDRDPDGDGQFDELRPNSQVPDYVCFPVESGSWTDGGRDLDPGSRPVLAGNGSRITWVETDDSAPDTRRVMYADLPRAANGALKAPAGFSYVPSGVTGFEHGTTRNDQSNVEQTQPVLNEDGSKLVYEAVQHPIEGSAGFAVIEFDAGSGGDQRVDGLGDANTAPGLEIINPPAVSDDGTRVAYDYYDSAVGQFRVYVSTISGANVSTQLESLDNDGQAARAAQPALSGDGRYLAFVTQATGMSNGIDPANGTCSDQTETEFHVVCQIVARDLVHDAQRTAADLPRLPSELVSTSIQDCATPQPAGRLCGGDSDSANPSIDNTGSEIGFDSAANDLVGNDNNDVQQSHTWDTFVHTWRPTVTNQPVKFGAVKVGSSKTKTVRASIQVTGSTPEAFGPVSLGKPSITGAASGEYKVVSTDCTGTTLHEGPPAGQPIDAAPESCTYKIRFTPALPGTRTANLQAAVGKNGYPRIVRDPVNPATVLQVFDPAFVRTLTGVGALPVVTPNPTTVNFGTRLPEDPVTKTVIITNTGTAVLVISGVVVNDTAHPGAKGDYTVDASDCLGSTVPGASCVITVTFRDHRVGIRDAVLVIDDNTLTGSTSIGLLARTKKPVITANPGVSPVRRVITVSGTGFAPKHDVEIGFDGAVQQTIKARANGTFDVQIVILPNGPQGPRTLFGHSVGYHKSIAADFPFLVALSSTDPAAGVVIRD